jgi:hypothetical protein
LLRSDQDLLVYRIVPSMRAPVAHTTRYSDPSPMICGVAVAAFRYTEVLGT